jgi:protein ImuA
MLFDPPATPCAWAMAELGLEPRALIVVHGREGPRGAAVRHLVGSADVLWALEQALRSGHAGAILAWLPQRLRADALRRLQLAAQAHDGPVFVLRGIDKRLEPSPAPLRLALHPAGPDALVVQLLKRRGPALSRPLQLQLPAVAASRRAVPAAPGAGGDGERAAIAVPDPVPADGGAGAW